jgi:TatD DNase family protein
VLHCFTGDEAELQDYLSLDLYIGITGWICDERRGGHLRDLVKMIPRNRLMLETDAPYLLPRDAKPRPAHHRNEPMYLKHISEVVATCVGKPAAQLAAETTENAQRFFGLPRV